MNASSQLFAWSIPFLVAAASLPACGGDISGTGGSGGSSSASGTSTGTGPSGPLCAMGKVGLQGSLDGDDLDRSYPWTVSALSATTFQSFFKTHGDLFLFGEAAFSDGATGAATGILRFPMEGPSGGTVFCAGAGSSLTLGGADDHFELASLALLGACPGTPVAGEVTACLGANGCIPGHTFVGDLDGVSFNWSSNVVGWSGAFDVFQVRTDNGAILAIDIAQDTVIGGLLVMPPDGPDAHAVYCIGSGSLTPGGPQPNGIAISLQGLSRLGTCADASAVEGAVSGCTH